MTAPPTELLPLIYQRPGFLLRRAHQLSVGIFEEECRDVGLTPSQYGVLTVLQQARGCGQATVARALGFDRVTTLRVLRGLQERGLVQRLPAAGKRQALALTAAGTQMLVPARQRAERISQRLLAPLAADEQAQLLHLLRKLCAGLEPVARTRLSPPGC